MKKRSFLKWLPVVLMLTLMVMTAACGKKGADSDDPQETDPVPTPTKRPNVTITDYTGTHHAVIDVVNYGEIAVELDGDTAPITVENFIKLAQSGFYDGLTFHRVMDQFMIQGGDPKGDGTGGSPETIKGEFAANGVENNISHVRGVISMARRGNPYMDSASSQFFIMHADYTGLDGQYAAFGHVTSGMEVVDEIVKRTAQYGDYNGTIYQKSKQAVIRYITILD